MVQPQGLSERTVNGIFEIRRIYAVVYLLMGCEIGCSFNMDMSIHPQKRTGASATSDCLAMADEGRFQI